MPDAPKPEYDAHSQRGREGQTAAERRALHKAKAFQESPEARHLLELDNRLQVIESFTKTLRGGPGIEVKGNIIALLDPNANARGNLNAAPATMRIRALKLVGTAFVPVTIQLNAQEVG